MNKNKTDIKNELWFRGVLSYLLDPVQKQFYDLYYTSTFKLHTWLMSRRQGKCLKKGTLVMTPGGPIAINDIKIGDLVYGYNNDGTITTTPVIDVISSGIKKVKDYTNHGKIMFSCTDEHQFLFQKSYMDQRVESRVGDIDLNHNRIVRKFVEIPMGSIYEPHAYAIGALLGDGCSKQNTDFGTRQIFISSENETIPKHLSSILGCSYKKNGGSNYTWCLTNEIIKNKSICPVSCSYYTDWIYNRYAHEKIIDIDVIKTWDRKSCLALLAGLIDTDGMCTIGGNILTINLGMQAKSVIDAVKYLLMALFQFDANLGIDNRDKYKNGPLHIISVRNNLFSKRILKELDPYLLTPRKKWNDSYNELSEHNSNPDSVGVKAGDYYDCDTYDLSINNDSHLFLLANGLVTHNSYTLCILAIEQCLRNPNSIVKFISPTKTQVNTNIRPIMKQILEDCPIEIKPEFKQKDYIYYFPNGSEIQLAGTDNQHAERLRGSDSHIWIVDEAGSCNDLKNIVRNILIPTTLITKGRGILASTPPASADHDFSSFIEEAELRGSLIKKTIDDNPRITQQQKEELIAELGGMNSDACRRELYCELIKDSNIAVLPEFTPELEKEIVKEWPKPPFFDAYEAMDLGFKDLTAIIFAYYDFKNDKVIIEDEIGVKGQELHLPKLVEQIRQKERELWTLPTGELKKPYIRVSDINYIVTNEISKHSNYEINFIEAKKDDSGAAINTVRVMLAAKKIIIHPRCKTLIRHLRNVKYFSANNKSKLARSPDDSHYDFFDALKYLVRHIHFNRNPYPTHYNLNTKDLYVYSKEKMNDSSTQINVYKKIFNYKGKR